MPESGIVTLQSIFSVCASAAALASTVYLWLVRFNREKPSLAIEQVTPLKGEFVWPHHFPELYQALKPSEGEGLLCLWVDVAVINNSTLPNAVLQIDASVRLSDGLWRQANVRLREESRLPVNIQPHSTAGLALELTTKLPFDKTRSSNQDRIDQAAEQLSHNREFTLRVRGVGGKSFQGRMVVHESGICATESEAGEPKSPARTRPRKAA